MKDKLFSAATLSLSSLLLILLPLFMFSIPPACAGEWRVIPIRLDFDKSTRSGVISIANDGKEPLTVSVEADRWLQDADGKDRYEKSQDLIFFPKVLTIGAKEERVIRVGIKTPAIKEEKTYRLFISEDPGARKPQGNKVAIAIRFGVPIFVKPLQENLQGEIRDVSLEQGTLGFSVANPGNLHFRINNIIVTGTDAAQQQVFTKELTGWYVLAGSSRAYSVEISRETCLKLRDLKLEVKADGAVFNRNIDVDQASCLSR